MTFVIQRSDEESRRLIQEAVEAYVQETRRRK